MPKNCLGLFAKYWTPGQVKTRLASIGGENASELYRRLLLHLVRELSQTGDSRTIVYTPGEHRNSFAELAQPNWSITCQTDGDLGSRMKAFFDQQLSVPLVESKFNNARKSRTENSTTAEGRSNVIVIGSDCPLISPSIVEEAFQILERSSVVIGPCTDGGYYLIGLNQPHWEIFDKIAWSTDQVFSQTLWRLKSRGIPFETLPEMTDIDTSENLAELIDFLKRVSNTDAAAARLLQDLNFH